MEFIIGFTLAAAIIVLIGIDETLRGIRDELRKLSEKRER